MESVDEKGRMETFSSRTMLLAYSVNIATSPEEVVSLRWHIHQSMLRKRLQKQWERNMAFISLSINAHGVTDGI